MSEFDAFDIHLRIVNETDYEFSGSYSAKAGKGHQFPKIPPRQTSEVITAKQQLATGAEGIFTLTCNGAFEDQKDSRLIFSVDETDRLTTALPLNFRLREVSPFLKLKLRFGNGIPAGTEKWGSAAFPTGGQPLGIQMTITPQPVVKQLSLLTYNTHLFKGSVATSLEWADKLFKHKSMVFKDYERARELVRRIKELQPDIVCLQEVWGKEMQASLAKQLGEIYPQVYIVPDEGHDYFPLMEGILDAVTNTSGLMVASQYSITNPCFKMYAGLTKVEDKGAKKGALAFSISFPISPTKSTTVNIGTTHCPTECKTANSDAQKAVRIAAKLTFGDGQIDSILAGDFNLHFKTDEHNRAHETSEYNVLTKTMTQHHARDIVHDCLPDLKDSYTDYGANGLRLALRYPKSENKDRIDYVYFAPGSKASRLEPMSAKVFHDWELADKLPVSDHYPVFVKFGVN